MRVKLTAFARRNRNKLLDRIADRHSTRVALEISSKIIACLQTLPQLPNQWPIVRTRRFGNVHKASVDGLTIILYQISGNAIDVLNITDARSNWQ